MYRRWVPTLLLVVAAATLIGLTWFGTVRSVEAERTAALARVAADASNQALAFEAQLRRELLAIEQTLAILEHEWESDPANFDLPSWRRRVQVLGDVSLHIYITDASGIIRTATRPELVGVDVSGRDYFKHEKALPIDEKRMFIGPATRGLVTNRWQMNMARRLDTKEGRFAGVIGVSYDTGSLARFFSEADLGPGGMVALIGTNDGRLRALVGPSSAEPGADLSDTAMFAAMRASPNGRWIGPSAIDGRQRIHAFRTVGDRHLAIVIGFDAASAMRASLGFRRGAQVFASGTTLFIVLLTGGVLREMSMARRRETRLREDRLTLAAANAELDAARRRADAKTAQLEATLAGMSDGVSMLDADLRLVAWNDLFAAFTGVPREMLAVGTPMEDILREQARLGEFGPVDVEAEVARRMALLRKGEAVGTIERPRPNGQTLELRRSALPGGGFVTLYADITGRKHAEAAMRRARDIAEAAAEAKSRFVAIVSHEIRTPLNTLLNALRLLRDTSITPPQQRLVEMAREAGNALLELTNDVLEMSKMEAGRLALRPALFALRPLMESTAALFREQAKDRGMSLTLHMGAGVPELIESDSGRLRQILGNLVGNAVKFAAPGAIRLSVEMADEGGRPMLRFAVSDPGPALSAAERARLFKPFSRLDRNHKGQAAGGTGLGLAISQGLASLMGADIGCEATPEGGNEFWLLLPFVRVPETAAVPQAARAPCGPLPRTRILLVEDVLPNQLVTATMLRRQGHLVDVADSGEAALAMVARQPYDVVLLDVFMPGMGGIEAARRIRALGGAAACVPLIAISANATPEDHERCRRAGIDDLIGKPVHPAALLNAIGCRVWRGRTPRDANPGAGAANFDPAKSLSSARIAELKHNLSPSVLGDLAGQCLKELGERLAQLQIALERADCAEIEQHAHAMAGLAASYGMTALDSRLRAVLLAARSGNAGLAQPLAAEIAGELRRAAPALKAALTGEATAA